MKRRSFILLLAFAMAGRTYAQQPEIRVALKTVPGTGPGSPRLSPAMLYGSYSFNFDSARSFKGIPATLANPVIKELDFQPQQGMYELYQRLNGRMSPETIVNELSKSSTDTLSLSAHPIRHIVFILSGFAANGKRVLITDANNNLDFGDDQPITYGGEIVFKNAGKGASVTGSQPGEDAYPFDRKNHRWATLCAQYAARQVCIARFLGLLV